ncbi:4702_t:CDS:1, partial [Scutellospora calospora]
TPIRFCTIRTNTKLIEGLNIKLKYDFIKLSALAIMASLSFLLKCGNVKARYG